MEPITTNPHDVANPDCNEDALAEALETDPVDIAPPGGTLLRFGWASAALHAHPELHDAWAHSEDRAIRRAIMRSARLPPEVAETVVSIRRSGMHTLGNNPTAPAHLLASNPGAQRRRAAIDRVAPGAIDAVRDRPNRPELVALGSGTIDLVLSTSAALGLDTAIALASRSDPAADPFVLARLVDRFGEPVWDAVITHASEERLRATAALSPAAATLRQAVTAA